MASTSEPALAADGRHHPAVQLLLAGHLGQPGGGGVHHPAEGVGDPPDLLGDQHLLEGREAAPAELLGHVDGLEAELRAPPPVRLQQPSGSSPPPSSASTSWGSSSSARALAAAWISRSASDIG